MMSEHKVLYWWLALVAELVMRAARNSNALGLSAGICLKVAFIDS